MFRKLVANLPFSPALVGQLGFYAKRLKREEATRRLGLILTALALVLQSLTVFSPPESANAANASDMIHGGVRDKSHLLQVYDSSARGNGDLKAIMDYAGITREELASTKDSSINSIQYGKGDGAWLTWGRAHRFSSSQGEVAHSIPTSSGSNTVYSKPLWLFDSLSYTKEHGSTYDAFVGTSAKLGKFAIFKDCGNLTTRVVPHPVPAGSLTASCTTVQGIAYDGRNRSTPVRVLLYFDGPPGVGKKVGPIVANGTGNSFSYPVPQEYRVAQKATEVWGVLLPLPGWNESTVPLKGVGVIPAKCVTVAKPAATCVSLKNRVINRTQHSLVAQSNVENGATIKSYRFVVKDSSGKVVSEKIITSSAIQIDSGVITLSESGTYQASVVVTTSLGEVSSASCTTTLAVAPPEKCPLKPELLKTHPDCKPCATNPQIWYKDDDCQEHFTQSKQATNLTKGTDATTATADGSDRIEYKLTIANVGQVPVTTDFQEQLSDVVEYATIQDTGGGTYAPSNHILSWGKVTLKAGETQSRTFVVQVSSAVSATARGTSDPGSFDCIMTNTFGNSTQVTMNCPAPKVVESTVTQLPKTGPGENMLFAGAVTSVVTYFYARSRQMTKEVRLIRHEFNTGAL